MPYKVLSDTNNLQTSFRLPRICFILTSPGIFGIVSRWSLMQKTASAFGTKIASSVLPILTDTYALMLGAPAVGHSGFNCGHKLFSPQFHRLIPTPAATPPAVGYVCMEVCPKPALAIPDSQGQASKLQSPIGAIHHRQPILPPNRGLMNPLD